MADSNTPAYYRGRQQKERALAAAAILFGIAEVHAELVRRYVASVTGSDAEPPPSIQLLHR